MQNTVLHTLILVNMLVEMKDVPLKVLEQELWCSIFLIKM